MAKAPLSEPQGEATDLGALWTQAVNKYVSDTGHDLSRMRAKSIGDIKTAAESDAKAFEGFRHKGDKADKVRSAFGNHLDGMQKCWKGIEMAGAAAGVFPPAMPVGIVFAACGNLLGAFAAVKAEYDKVEDFFLQSSRFFERLSLIEGKTSDAEPLRRAIVRVFSTQLSICGLVEKRTAEKGARFKQWLSALWNFEDPDLAGAYANLQACIDELGATVGFASYAAIKSTQDVTLAIDAKADKINENLLRFREEQHENMLVLYERSLSHIDEQFSLHRARTEAVLTMTAERQDQSLAKFQASLESTIRKAIVEKTRPDDQEKDRRKPVSKNTAKGDVSDKKFKAVKSIKTYFDGKSEQFPRWRDAQKENAAQHQDVQESFVEGTATWLFGNPAFQQWKQGISPLLWLSGSEGIGKSFLSYAAWRNLHSADDGHTSVAYFYFKEDFPYLQSAQNAFACAALQIAESNPRYAEQIAAKLNEDGERKEASTWQRFFLSPFSSTAHGSDTSSASSGRLFLILDGLDEAQEQQKEVVFQFVADLHQANSGVHVLITSRPEDIRSVDRSKSLSLHVTKEMMIHDINVVIRNRLSTLARLKKFSLPAKKAIRKKVATKADGMLYVEHMMRRLAYIGREGAVRKELQKMPDSLHDLYKLMLDDCRKGRTPEQYEALKRLFAWLAFSKRSLSLAEASELVKVTMKEGEFDVEDEIIGRSSRILELSRARLFDEDQRDDVKDDDNDDTTEDREGELDEYRNASLTFQERSLRQYFRAVSRDATGDDELRTPAATAHFTIMKMCIEIIMDAAKMEDGEADSELTSYAVKYWYEHFNELEPQSTPTDTYCSLLDLLYRVVNNDNNIAHVFERYAYHIDVYPEKEEATSQVWYETILVWIEKRNALPEVDLSPEIEAWATGLDANPKNLLVPLAKGHIRNWLTGYEWWQILEGYLFATAVLKITGRFQEMKDDPEVQILSVANAFDVQERDAKALRSIGTQLLSDALRIEDVENKKKYQENALNNIKKALEMVQGNFFEEAATSLILADLYEYLPDYRSSIMYLDRALQTSSKIEPEKERVSKKIFDYRLIIRKARYYSLLDEKDTALELYHEARKLTAEDTIGSYWLDEMVGLLNDKNDGDGQRTMDIFRSWIEKERNKWFDYRLQCFSEPLDPLFRAAKLTGCTGLALDWLNAFEKTLGARSLIHFNMKAAIAYFYLKVLGDVEKAKEAMHTTLNLQVKVDASEEDTLNLRISDVRMDLAGIIFSQFRSSSDPAKKEALLEEIKSLPGIKTGDEFQESHIGMLVANMLRIMGPAREYYRYMNDIFKTCIDGLEDSVAWNDGDSLRLLAKVLSSLDGLERDARITISSQFSIMNRTIFYGSETGSKAASENGDIKTLAEDGGKADDERTASQNRQVDSTADDKSISMEVTNGTPVAITASKQEKSTEAKQDNPAQEQKETADNPVQDQSGTANSSSQAQTDTAAPSPDTNTTAEEHKATATPTTPEEDDDQDIAEFWVGCDGNCGREIRKWTEPFYLCLICPNADLCEECHVKRLAWNNNAQATTTSSSSSTSENADAIAPSDGATPQLNSDPDAASSEENAVATPTETQTSWTTFCGENHHYIKGPMKGWRGIKDGVIRIGDEELPVKEWIRQMKEERWPKAWERYWLRQGGLKDIDVE